YGQTKLEGERQVEKITEGSAVILRSAWIYGVHEPNFVLTMLPLMGEKESVDVVADQVGTPTWDHALAEAIWMVAARREMRAIPHWTPGCVASWYGFAVAIQEEAMTARLLERAARICPISTDDYRKKADRPPKADRPWYGPLDKTATWAALGE